MTLLPSWQADRPAPLRIPLVVEETLRGFMRERFPKARPSWVADAVAELSEAFTVARADLARSYLNQPPVRSAYLAYFHPLQMLRALGGLGEASDRARARGLLPAPDDRPLRVVDLGAGLGAMSQALALLRSGGADRDKPWEVTLVDHQRSAVRDGAELTRRVADAVGGAAPRVRTVAVPVDAWLRGAAERKQRFDVVLAGAVWNEWREPWAPILRRILGAVETNGLVVIVEPALPPVARRLMELRDEMLERTTTVAPCTHEAACPLLALRKDWCFTTRPAALPESVARLARGLGHQTRDVRYAMWAFTPKSAAAPFESPPKEAARVVTDAMDGWQVLCTDGQRERVPSLAVPRGTLALRR